MPAFPFLVFHVLISWFADAQQGAEPSQIPLDLATVEAACRARDTRTSVGKWTFVIRQVLPSGEVGVVQHGVYCRSDSKWYLRKEDHVTGIVDEAAWNGLEMRSIRLPTTGGTLDLPDYDKRYEIDAREGEHARAYTFPDYFGLTPAGKSITHWFNDPHVVTIDGVDGVAGQPCSRLTVWMVTASGERVERMRLWLDVQKTLLALKVEKLAYSEASHSTSVTSRWTVLNFVEQAGVFVPTLGHLESYVGGAWRSSTTEMDYEPLDCDAAETKSLFDLEIPRGAHVRDRITGKVWVFGTDGHEGLWTDNLQNTLCDIRRRLGAAPDGPPPIDRSDEWKVVPCGAASAYLYLNSLGYCASIEQVCQALPTSVSGELSLDQVRCALAEFGVEVAGYECAWEQLPEDPGLLIVFLPARHGHDRGGHFAIGLWDEGVLTTFDPWRDHSYETAGAGLKEFAGERALFLSAPIAASAPVHRRHWWYSGVAVLVVAAIVLACLAYQPRKRRGADA